MTCASTPPPQLFIPSTASRNNQDSLQPWAEVSHNKGSGKSGKGAAVHNESAKGEQQVAILISKESKSYTTGQRSAEPPSRLLQPGSSPHARDNWPGAQPSSLDPALAAGTGQGQAQDTGNGAPEDAQGVEASPGMALSLPRCPNAEVCCSCCVVSQEALKFAERMQAPNRGQQIIICTSTFNENSCHKEPDS